MGASIPNWYLCVVWFNLIVSNDFQVLANEALESKTTMNTVRISNIDNKCYKEQEYSKKRRKVSKGRDRSSLGLKELSLLLDNSCFHRKRGWDPNTGNPVKENN